MSYMADRDHIAITSRDASTTRRKVSVPGCPVAPPLTVTHSESSDTYSRIAPVSEIVPGNYPPGTPGTQFAISYSANARHRPCARLYIATASSRSPLAAPSMAAAISAADWSLLSASSLSNWTSPP
jgi:hypothetical protein